MCNILTQQSLAQNHLSVRARRVFWGVNHGGVLACEGAVQTLSWPCVGFFMSYPLKLDVNPLSCSHFHLLQTHRSWIPTLPKGNDWAASRQITSSADLSADSHMKEETLAASSSFLFPMAPRCSHLQSLQPLFHLPFPCLRSRGPEQLKVGQTSFFFLVM